MPKSSSEKQQEGQPEDRQLKKLTTRVPIEEYEKIKFLSDGENRWEARMLRKIIKEWLAMQIPVHQSEQSSSSGPKGQSPETVKAVNVGPRSPSQSHIQKMRKTGSE